MIKKIKWKNDDILGNLELDFSKSDTENYNTIILAGENGTGKTAILDTLSEFLNLGSAESFEYIQYDINDATYTITFEQEHARYGFHTRKNEVSGDTKKISSNRRNNRAEIEKDLEDIRHYGVVYSKARSGFNTRKITSSTTEQLDINKYEVDENDDFTSIKQLMVDIDIQDSTEWKKISKSGKGISFNEFERESRQYRFTNAFNSFFDTVRFEGIDHTDTKEMKVIFKKYGKEINIDRLSTGEKQIVFRGAYLLKNARNVSGGIVLIDEPELSMHPKWQERVLEYYRNLFNKNGKQDVQIIIATHSEYVLRAALQDRENTLVVVLNDINGTIKPQKITAPTSLPIITAAETNYLAFGIASVDYHIELYGYLQYKNGNLNVSHCDAYIASQTGIYDPNLHSKPSSFTNKNGYTTNYQTLPTYIRNSIDHPNPQHTYTQEELKCSIELLRKLCK